LRVVTAIMDKVEPSPSDADELRRFAPKHANDPLDLLACKAVQKALAEEATARAIGAQKIPSTKFRAELIDGLLEG